MFGRRILILVPHPDDEVVACMAALTRAQQNGAQIFALYLTHGCLARQTLWPWQRPSYDMIVERRLDEGRQAARFLDIEPVGWSSRTARHLWQELPAAHEDIKAAVTKHVIDQLWFPAYEGGNPDHDGLNAIGQLLKPTLSVLEFAEYNFLDGKACAQTFPAPNGSEKTIFLTDAEQKQKRAALNLYKSERRNLNYVGTVQECWRPLADYDYNKPPHPGKLWYMRFQWVPFRHPRVDFTDPTNVSRAIEKFLSANKQRRANQP